MNEEDYISTLKKERRAFAWVLKNVGNDTSEKADQAAMTVYYYEPPEEKFRDLIFHELSWHWAMLHLYGQSYWWIYPELSEPSAEYLAFCNQQSKNL